MKLVYEPVTVRKYELHLSEQDILDLKEELNDLLSRVSGGVGWGNTRKLALMLRLEAARISGSETGD